MNRKTVVLILLIHSLVTSLILIGCGVLDDNSQPSIEPITISVNLRKEFP